MQERLAGVVGAVFGAVLEIWLVIEIVVLLERSERKELLHQVTVLARKKAGRDLESLLSRCGKRIRRAVSRWAWSVSKRKGLSKAQIELKKLTWEARR